jgi:hypothetical protein
MKQEYNAKAKKLLGRIHAANLHYNTWMRKFKVDALKKFYEGQHYVDQTDEYYINMFWATLEIKLPGMVFSNPKFYVTPKPSELKNDAETAFTVASNLEDALFDFTSEEKNHFADEGEMACLDSFFGFGVVEIGYSAKFVENPNLPKPEIPSDYADGMDEKKGKVIQLAVEDESVYIKQIPFENFRVSAINHRYLDRCDWFGYYEYMRVADLKADPNLRNTDKFATGHYSSAEVGLGLSADTEEEAERQAHIENDCVKVWRIWDNRSKKRFMFCEDHCVIMHETKWKINPIEILMYRFARKGFYPIPYTFNWIPQQNELNETRETHRQHRRKFKRLYEMKKGTADLDEAKSFINGPDGGIIEVNANGQIQPVPNADLGASANISMQLTKDDFNIISGTSAEAQGAADRITATQAKITDQRATVRESRERLLVGKFLMRVAKKVLMVMKENYVNPRVVESQRKDEPMLSDISTERKVREIDPVTDFGGENFDFAVNVSVESMSPVTMEEEKNKFLQFIALLKQFPEFSMSPSIIREMAFRTGYKNETIIKEFQQMAQLAMVSQIQQGQANLGAQGGNMAQQTVAQNSPPNVEQMENQMAEQGVPMGIQ